jgi:hypothetical protein
VGDSECEDEEREEESDEFCHGEEVGGQKALPVTKLASTMRWRSPLRMATSHRARGTRSAPFLEANQRPVATIQTVQSRAVKLRHAVMVLLRPMASAESVRGAAW